MPRAGAARALAAIAQLRLAPDLAPNSSRSTRWQIACAAVMCICGSAQSLRRARRARSHSACIAVGASREKPMVVSPNSRAAFRAATIFGERPGSRNTDEHIAVAAERANLPLEHLVEAVVVADRGQRRGVGCERDGGEGARSSMKRPTNSAAMCWASAALPPLPASRTLPPLFSAAAMRSGDGGSGGDEFFRRPMRARPLLRAAEMSEDGFLTRIGHGTSGSKFSPVRYPAQRAMHGGQHLGGRDVAHAAVVE